MKTSCLKISLLLANLCTLLLAQIEISGAQGSSNGVVVRDNGKYSSLSVNAEDVMRLLPDTTDLPGYTVVVPQADDPIVIPGVEYGHTCILLNKNDMLPETKWNASRIVREWFRADQVQAYLSRAIQSLNFLRPDSIRAEVNVYNCPAASLGNTFEHYRQRSNVVICQGTPSGFTLGEGAWYFRDSTNRGFVAFTYDRGACRVDAPDVLLAESLAQCVLYRLLVHPKGIVKPMPVPQLLVEGKPLSSPLIASLNGVVVVPVSLLQPFGVEVQTNRTPEIWTVTLRRGSRWVQVQAFGWEAQTPSDKVKLERAVFPFEGQLVVPLRQVAEALGLSVQAQ
ncbi:MAG: hypothetical protein KatS3mg022_0338 [Armatimonadota bacterium]|nr:MAG: hypothetical protein KatS3mg022_0338 [Armatimonadota bacterium]